MGRRTDLVASACLFAFALSAMSFELNVVLTTEDRALVNTVFLLGGLALLGAFLFVWSWKQPVKKS